MLRKRTTEPALLEGGGAPGQEVRPPFDRTKKVLEFALKVAVTITFVVAFPEHAHGAFEVVMKHCSSFDQICATLASPVIFACPCAGRLAYHELKDVYDVVIVLRDIIAAYRAGMKALVKECRDRIPTFKI